MAGPFDGLKGRLAASVMAAMNADMEAAAIRALGPSPDARVLAIGFGPGVGVEKLARRLAQGHVCGVDPSAEMVRAATKRNRRAIAAGRVELTQTTAASLPWPGASFDAAIAVNSLQLWSPLDASLAEVARVLRPGEQLVTLTHRWAAGRRGAHDAWVADMRAALERHGFTGIETWTGRSRTGATIGIRARRAA
ncbi:MAG: class I SAM-dependent methyltransferase [Hyphomicrobiales bacterium]